MHRRSYLAGLAAGLGALAGCGSQSDGSPTMTPTDPGLRAPSTDVSLPLNESALTRGAAKDAIAAITEPAFGPDWSTATLDESLDDSDRVVGVVRDGDARAYPLRILDYHEIVNDAFAGPLLVTFCPLCGSGVTAVRRVDGTETTFGVSGLLWRSDLVMYDELTGSLWSQLLATAVRGPKTGTELELVPSQITTWGEWQASYPETQVLLPPPDSVTITGNAPSSYERDPYPGYDSYSQVGIGENDFEDDRLHPKTHVIGVAAGDESRAYPLPAVDAAGVVNDEVGDVPVVVAATGGETLVAFERRVDGTTLEFARADPTHLSAGGSTWQLPAGRAIDGPYEGQVLDPASEHSQLFWFAWLEFHPDTTIYRGE